VLTAAFLGIAALVAPAVVVPAAAADFKVDGERLYVSGAIYGRHEFETLSKHVRDNPKVKIVVMKDFYGGTAGTAGFFNFTKFIRDNKLATEVDGACFSACAVAFMGGVKRSVSPKADPKNSFVAFHGAYFGGGAPDLEFRGTFVSALRRYSGGRMPEMVAHIAYAMPPDGFLLFLDGRKVKPKDGISVIACQSKKEVDTGACTGISDIDSHKVGVYTH
jgi:hypothetical protein